MWGAVQKQRLFFKSSNLLQRAYTVIKFRHANADGHVIIHDLRLVLLILHCPYTQINSSLRFIFSLLFLNNPLIDLKPFMNG